MLPVAIFTGLYLSIAAIFAVSHGNIEFIFYIAVVLAIGLGIVFIHRRSPLSRGVLWMLTIWGLMHMLGGLLSIPEGFPINGEKRVLYSLWLIPGRLKYDHIVHAYGFGVATWASWQVLRPMLKNALPHKSILIICVLSGMGLGALNEIVEFVATLLIPSTNVGGYMNTGWDLVSNMVGATLAALVIWLLRSKGIKA